ncbi:hypothetical protein HaLaN_07501 [Haematococcus lacustris]|uniref:Uncharacterized protein n=1 Tax=Haematococcus lacustris TaxID=44745 RepID=A0A699YY43_HAELA|nr:hypothetical protein HaLaN_07501 [Haematococcus lacustris]
MNNPQPCEAGWKPKPLQVQNRSGKEYPALGFKKLRDRAPKAQAQQPVAQ